MFGILLSRVDLLSWLFLLSRTVASAGFEGNASCCVGFQGTCAVKYSLGILWKLVLVVMGISLQRSGILLLLWFCAGSWIVVLWIWCVA
ncbi:hypothetical protein U1Q18_044017 [Sarracenia purpurea var. burkii]